MTRGYPTHSPHPSTPPRVDMPKQAGDTNTPGPDTSHTPGVNMQQQGRGVNMGIGKCAHCNGQPLGYATVGDQRTCHPDGNNRLDCYHLVTVAHHPMPCAYCREVRLMQEEMTNHGGNRG